ncbi:MAG: PilC/PilY family type IV pilus protein, partial [Syntrophobacteraceae bacterium]
LSQDKIVVIRYDESQNRTIVDRYSDCNSDGDPDPVFDSNCDGTPNIGSPAKETVSLSDLKPIWEASSVLGRKSPANRVIKTFADKNVNSVVNTNEFIDFTIGNKNVIKPFLGGVVTGDLDNVINYIRGSEVTGFRNRVLTDGDTATRYVLGDIITSTPTPVAAPMDNYDMIYGDKTYLNYYRKYKDRPTYIFAGANDGMLHAFYGGRFHPTDDPSTATLAEDAWIEVESGKTLGDEVWAYIPKNVLPHLKWLTCQSYPHVYYVDLKPRIFDARIFQTDPDGTPAWDNPNAIHPNGWGTILVCGMRFGGPNITVKADFDGSGGNSSSTKYFKSAYFAIDITQLDNPRLLWEKTYDQMGYTFSYPAIMRLQNGTASKSVVAYADQKWVIVLGNGPTDFNGDPSGYGHIYVVDLLTGNLVRDVQTATTGNVKEFMGSPVAVDLDTNYDTDVVYIGSTIKNSNGSYSGKMYRLAADNNDTGVTPNFDPAQWVPSLLMDVGKPITAAPGVSQIADSIWVYFGTGRYIGQQDKTSTALQSFYGIEDPCSFVHGTCGNALPGTASVSAANLLDVTNISVYETGYVTGLPSGLHTWNDLLNAFSGESNFGWVLNLAQPSGGLPSERILAKPAVIGGLVIFPSFFPNSDVCAFSGDSRLYSLFYGTGTAWQQSTIGTSSTQTVTVNSKTLKKILTNTALGPGLPSQVAIHVGAEQGGKTFTQMSTSSIFQLSFMPAMPMKSGFLYWRETLD